MKERKRIIIVGGGIAGLITAAELGTKHEVILLEANKRLGGRIFSTKEPGFSAVIDGGAEFIHGKAKKTLALLKKAGIQVRKIEAKMYRKENGVLKEQEDMIEGWDELIKKMKKVNEDLTLSDFLEKYFGEEKYSALRRSAIGFTEGFDIANPERVSIKSLYKEWSKQEEQYHVTGGYGLLIGWLLEKCEKNGSSILTGALVKQIDWEDQFVTVYTIGGKKYEGDRAIVCTPLPTLQSALSEGSINFTPPIDEYVSASKKIGFGQVIKVVIEFKSAFWKEDTGFVLSDEIFPTWWTRPPYNLPLLTGWAGGRKANHLKNNSENSLMEKAIMSLSNIFELSFETIKQNIAGAKVFNWANEPLILGGYSYITPESADALEMLNKPLGNAIYFCGEAFYQGSSPGTVEAAIAHAGEVIKKVRDSF